MITLRKKFYSATFRYIITVLMNTAWAVAIVMNFLEGRISYAELAIWMILFLIYLTVSWQHRCKHDYYVHDRCLGQSEADWLTVYGFKPNTHTCFKRGLITWFKCSKCNHVKTEQKTI